MLRIKKHPCLIARFNYVFQVLFMINIYPFFRTPGSIADKSSDSEINQSQFMKAKSLQSIVGNVSGFLKLILLFVLMAGVSATLSAQTVTLDQADLDYAPGETVGITGTGWLPGETVTLAVANLTDPEVNCGVSPSPHSSWTTVADGGGSFSATWYVNECEFGAELMLTADGAISGFTYEIFFTDAQTKVSSVTISAPQTDAVTYGTSSITEYTVTLNLAPGATAGSSTLTVNGLPTGVTYSFLPASPVTLLAGASALSVTLKVTNNASTTPAGTSGIKVNTTSNNNNSNSTDYIVTPKTLSITAPTIASKVYDGTTTSGTVTVGTLSGFVGSQTVTATATGTYLDANAGAAKTATIVYTLANGANGGLASNYSLANGTATGDITKANQTITWATPTAITYGTVLSATQLNASAPGALTYTPALGALLDAGTQSLQVDAALTANYNAATKQVTLTVNKASQTITWANPSAITYGTLLSATQLNATVAGSATVGASAPGGLTYTPVSGTLLNTGAQTLQVDAALTSNYNAATKQVTQTVNKATPIFSNLTASQTITYGTPTITLTGNIAAGTLIPTGSVSVAFDGTSGTGTINALDGSFSIAVNTASVAAAVTPYVVTYSYASTANFNAASDNSTSITVNKAPANITLSNLNQTYDGTAKSATATTSPAGLNVVSITYNGSATSPTNANSYPVVASLTNANYQATNATGTLVIAKASPVFSELTVSQSITYGTPSITLTGKIADGSVVPTGSITITFDGVSATAAIKQTGGSNVLGTFTATITTSSINASAVPYTITYAYAGDGNFGTAQDASTAITVNKANATIIVNGYTGTYNALAHGATGTATGVGGVDLSAGLNLGATFSDVPGGTSNWTFTGGTNYNNQSGTAAIVINPAAATIVVNGYTGTYDAASHGATLGSATGVAGANLASSVTIAPTTYTNYPGGPVAWSFANNNYVSQSGSVNIDIAKADAVVNVTGYTGVYDSYPHGATGSAVGVSGDLAATGSSLDLGASFTNVPGGTANWVFTGGTNYLDESGSVAIVIDPAAATIVVNGYTGTYDAAAHGAILGSATGVASADLSASVTIAPTTYTDYPGGPVAWSFTNNNYVSQSGSVNIDIAKADATVTVTGYSGIYDAAAHGATGTVVGVTGDLAAAGSNLNLGSSFTNYPGGTASWTFTGGTNYNNQSGTAAIVINKAPLSVVADNKNKYCGQVNPAFTGTLTGVLGSDGIIASYSTVATQVSGAGTYPIIPALVDPNGKIGNYQVSPSNGTLTINGISVDASASSAPVPNGSAALLSATVTSTVSGNLSGIPVVFTLNNGNGGITTYSTATNSSGLATFSVTGLAVEVYKVDAVAGSGCATSTAYLAVYDPNGGFVTGGGWITSPLGAYVADANLTGKANFGFNSKYKKGSNVPEGNTEFQFQTGNLNFSSSSYSSGSLVIAGKQAIYKGVGTINGATGYSFMVSAVDGQVNGGGNIDKFRMKIWTTATGAIVYDNQLGGLDNADATTVLGGGSIVIHSTNKAEEVTDQPVVIEKAPSNFQLEVYPNPTSGPVNFKFTLDESAKATLEIFSMTGALMDRIFDADVEKGMEQTALLNKQLPEGVYIYRLTYGNHVRTGKVIKTVTDR